MCKKKKQDYEDERRVKNQEPIKGKTPAQKDYIHSIKNHQYKVVITKGSAGSGKTFLSSALAIEKLTNGEIQKIIVTRPVKEAGESLGFLPGELEDKFAPYFYPILDIFEERAGESHVKNLIRNKKIETTPIAYMRGRNFKDCIVIVDEAQNCSKEQLYLILTRLGERCKLIINGDPVQKDIKNSGLEEISNRIKHLPFVKVINFTKDDIVRSGEVQEIVECFE